MADFLSSVINSFFDASLPADLFLKLFNMSVTASWLILAVLLLRVIFKKAPKWIRVALWGAAALRLLLPFSLPSRVSLVPSAETVPDTILTGSTVTLNTGFSAVDEPFNTFAAEHYQEGMTVPAGLGDAFIHILALLWVLGLAAMLIYALVSFLRLRRQVGASVREDKNVYLCDGIKSPFILGVFRPRIYIPSRLSGRQKELILMHEQAHLKRFDHLWKPLGFLLLSVYWFNPVIWVAYILLCRDIELACDERVTKDLSDSERTAYSQALLDCACERRAVTACPVAFGEVGVKQRVKTVLNYKKPAFWIVLAALLLSVVCAVCFLTDPKTDRYYGKAPADGTLLNISYPELIAEVNRALCEQSRSSYFGEFVTSEICVLGSDETEKEMNLYFFYQVDSFGFDNGFFTDVGGSGGATAAVFTIGPDGNYKLSEIRDTGMGSDYGKSLKRIFPSALAGRALSGPTETEADIMWQGCAESAQEYLRSIGRSGVEVRKYMDVPHTLLTDLGVSVEVANRVHEIAYVTEAGYVGVWESVESGVRYVSENGYDKEKGLLTFKKYEYESGRTVFDLALNASTGEVVYGASEPTEQQPKTERDGKVPTTYNDDGLIIPETAAAIPDTSRQTAVTPFDLPDEAPAAVRTADNNAWTTTAAPANGRETTFSEATQEDFETLGTEFDSGYFLNLIDTTFIQKPTWKRFTADYDAGTATDAQLRRLMFFESRCFICDRFFGEPETVQFTEQDDPFPELKNETHTYVKYDKTNIDWIAAYILNTKAPDPEKFLEGAVNAGYKDGAYYFVDEIFGVEDEFTSRAAKITKLPDNTYSVEIEYRDVFTEELLNGGGTAILGLRDFGGQKIWSVISYHADITWA